MDDQDLKDLDSTISNLKKYRPDPRDMVKHEQLQATLEGLKAVNAAPVPFHWVIDQLGRLEYEPGYKTPQRVPTSHPSVTHVSREQAEALGPVEFGDSTSDEEGIPIASLLTRQQIMQPDIDSNDEGMEEEIRRVRCSPMRYDEGEYQVKIGRSTRRVVKRFVGRSTRAASENGGICEGM